MIRGNIAEAALADVVQLLALGRRSGRLSVARDGELGVVYFVDGYVAHAVLAHRRDPLGTTLVRAGVLDDADLRAALVEQAAEPETPLGVLLVRRGCVPRDVLVAQITMQTAEAAYDLLGWTRGTFSFEVDAAPVAAELTPRLDVGSLLLEAARRADESVLIAADVPGPTSTFALVPATGVAAAPLDEEQARVATWLDGVRDVRAVADAAALSTYQVSRVLHTLVRAGRVRRIAAIGPDAVPGRLAGARADEHLNLGIAFARAGLLDEALRELRRVLELRPGDVSARSHLGGVALRAGRYDEAAAVLGEAASSPGATASAVHALGVARHQLGLLDLADEAYVRAASLGLGDDPRHLTARAALALDRAEWLAAREYLDRARTRWSEPPAVWYHYAVLAAMGVRDLAGAAVLARDGAAAHPRSAVLLADGAALCATASPSQDLARALEDVETALAERPDLAPAHRLRGDLQYRLGQHDRARDAYLAATRLAPDGSAVAWARLGSLALRAGDRGGARRAWGRACSLQPDHPTARANLAALGRSGDEAPTDS